MTRLAFAHYTPIEPATFDNLARLERCGTQSWWRVPGANQVVWQARTTPAALLGAYVFPVWLLGPEGDGDFDHFDHPDYKRILLRDAMLNFSFIAEASKKRFPGELAGPPYNVLLLHCVTCDHYAIVDGNHRTVRFLLGLHSAGPNADLLISVKSGSKWAADTPDMMKICACIAREQSGSQETLQADDVPIADD